MYRYEQIREVHLEITSRCNAACPQCPRNFPGGDVNPSLPLTELSLGDIQRIFPDEFLRQLKKIYLCGNYGDPMVARDVLDVLEHIRAVSPRIELGFHTNGSGRTPEFWARLARVVTYCRFGIDGLADTNAIYRRRTDWDTILESVRAFVSAGGRAEWDFLIFRHNEHQVEEARSLAESLGFRRFFAKKTGRFYSSKLGKNLPKLDVRDRDGAVLYALEPPENPAYMNPAAQEIAGRLEGQETHTRRYLETARIRCKVEPAGKIYVSAEGLVFPCCFLANLYPAGRPERSAPVWRVLRDKEMLSVSDSRSLRDIVEGDFFQTTVPDGWREGSLDEVRLEPCARVCGEVDIHKAQYSPSLI